MTGSVNIRNIIAKAVENSLTVIRQHPADIIAIVFYKNDDDFKQALPQEYKTMKSAKTHFDFLKQVKKTVAQELGKQVIFVPFDKENYTQWLLSKKLKDNQPNRAAWAASKLKN